MRAHAFSFPFKRFYISLALSLTRTHRGQIDRVTARTIMSLIDTRDKGRSLWALSRWSMSQSRRKTVKEEDANSILSSTDGLPAVQCTSPQSHCSLRTAVASCLTCLENTRCICSCQLPENIRLHMDKTRQMLLESHTVKCILSSTNLWLDVIFFIFPIHDELWLSLISFCYVLVFLIKCFFYKSPFYVITSTILLLPIYY